MPSRLVALDEGPDILLDRAVVVVGRHPQCDARLDSIRISRRHCCMTEDSGEVVVRDLGSTNGIRINGQRVETGRLRPGDELSIAHIRYRLEGEAQHHAATLAESPGHKAEDGHAVPFKVAALAYAAGGEGAREQDSPLAAAVRELLPAGLADKCKIQVIVQMPPASEEAGTPEPQSCPPDLSP